MPFSAFTQNKQWIPEIGLGISSNRILDEAVSTYKFKSTAAGIFFNTSLSGNEWTHQVKISLDGEKLNNAIDEKSRSYGGRLELGYNLMKVYKPKLAFGFSSRVYFRDAFYKNIDNTHFYWTSTASVGLVVNKQFELGDRSLLSVGFNFQLLGLYSRTKPGRLTAFDKTGLFDIVKSNFSNISVLYPARYFDSFFNIRLMPFYKIDKKNIFLQYSFTYLKIDDRAYAQYKESRNIIKIGCTL